MKTYVYTYIYIYIEYKTIYICVYIYIYITQCINVPMMMMFLTLIQYKCFEAIRYDSVHVISNMCFHQIYSHIFYVQQNKISNSTIIVYIYIHTNIYIYIYTYIYICIHTYIPTYLPT